MYTVCCSLRTKSRKLAAVVGLDVGDGVCSNHPPVMISSIIFQVELFRELRRWVSCFLMGIEGSSSEDCRIFTSCVGNLIIGGVSTQEAF